MRRYWPLAALPLLLAACQTDATLPPTAGQPAPVAAAPLFEPVAGEWEAARKANLRGGPGTEHPVVGSLWPGDRLTVLGQVPGTRWFALDDHGATVFLRSDLARRVPASLAQPGRGLPTTVATAAPVRMMIPPAALPAPAQVAASPAPVPAMAAPPILPPAAGAPLGPPIQLYPRRP